MNENKKASETNQDKVTRIRSNARFELSKGEYLQWHERAYIIMAHDISQDTIDMIESLIDKIKAYRDHSGNADQESIWDKE